MAEMESTPSTPQISASDLHVVDLNWNDLKEVRLVAELFVKVPLSWDPHYNWLPETIDKNEKWMLENKNSIKAILLKHKKQIVGLHLLFFNPLSGDKNCSIRTLWLHEKFRGQGWGSRLKGLGEQWARNRGAKKIVTHVYVNNPRMIEINRRKGFLIKRVEMHKEL